MLAEAEVMFSGCVKPVSVLQADPKLWFLQFSVVCVKAFENFRQAAVPTVRGRSWVTGSLRRWRDAGGL